MEITLIIVVGIVIVILGGLLIMSRAMNRDRLIKSLRQVLDSSLPDEVKVEMIKLILRDDGKNPPKVEITLLDEEPVSTFPTEE